MCDFLSILILCGSKLFILIKPFQERHAIAHAIAHAGTHTHAKVFKCVLNCMRKWNFWLHFFPTQLPVFDQDMWLYYTCLKQHFFSSVFFRFSLMLLFVWWPWLVSIYKNSFFSFLSRFALLTLDLSSEAATWGVL